MDLILIRWMLGLTPEQRLQDLKASYRGHAKMIAPDSEKLSSKGHHLFSTRFGPLDVHGSVENGLGYEDLVEYAETMEIAERTFHVLGLAFLIELKEDSKFEKDKSRLSLLKHTLSERGK